MRLGIVNGNGCTCDVCHTTLLSKEVIKIKSFVLDTTLDNTGRYAVLQIADMCPECYKKILGGIMHEGRKNKLNNKSSEEIERR